MEGYRSIEAYLGEPEKIVNGHLWYFCPLHVERTPSFRVTPANAPLPDFWHCFGCGEGGDLLKLILLKEAVSKKEAFDIRDGQEINEERYRANQEQIREMTAAAKTTRTPEQHPAQDQRNVPQDRRRNTYATEEEALLMSATARWWHEAIHAPIGQSCKKYSLARGGTHRALAQWTIGYAPGDPTRSLCTDLAKRLREVSPHWEELGLKLNIFGQDEKDHGLLLKMQYRLMFSCVRPEDGLVGYFQGRSLPYKDTAGQVQENWLKYFGAKSLIKIPFTLPVQDPVHDGVVISESPMGPFVLYGYGVYGAATLGTGYDEPSLLALRAGPRFLATDNDEPKAMLDHKKQPRIDPVTGEPMMMRSGEVQADRLMTLYRKAHQPAYRIEPPRETKGVDEWINATQSVDPLLSRMQEAQEKGEREMEQAS
jgi:hypothetical protein